MHPEARSFVAALASGIPADARVLEFGSRNINGGIRDLFPVAEYVGVDIAPGHGVDVIADAATYASDPVDVVVCCEVLEHTAEWREIIASARRNLRDGGIFIVTAATDPRAPHSAVDGGDITDGEWYANIDPDALRDELAQFDHAEIVVDYAAGDVRAVAMR